MTLDANIKRKWAKDMPAYVFLFLMYTLQGVPMGIGSAVPLVMQNSISYSQQSLFSLITLPFSLKILWAPLVDTIRLPNLGLRKSWLIPVQFLCSMMMIFGGLFETVERWVKSPGLNLNLYKLSFYFFILYFLMATQDIAVDGWALTLISKENQGLASPINTVGQAFGFFFANYGFFSVQSDQPSQVSQISKFFVCCGLLSLFASILVVLKTETSDQKTPGSPAVDIQTAEISQVVLSHDTSVRKRITNETHTPISKIGETPDLQPPDNSDLTDIPHIPNNSNSIHGALESYFKLFRLTKLKSVQSLVVLLLLVRLGFGPVESATSLKFIEFGVPTNTVAFLNQIHIPMTIFTAFVVGNLSKDKPMKFFFYGFVLRIFANVTIGLFCFCLKHDIFGLILNFEERKTILVGFLCGIMSLNTAGSATMFVSQMSFFAIISDTSMGGTYMTFLNTVANVGNTIATSSSLVLIEKLSIRRCVDATATGGELCPIYFDAYFLLVILGCIFSALAIPLLRGSTANLQAIEEKDWIVDK